MFTLHGERWGRFTGVISKFIIKPNPLLNSRILVSMQTSAIVSLVALFPWHTAGSVPVAHSGVGNVQYLQGHC